MSARRGYVKGPRLQVRRPVDNATAIVEGDLLDFTGSGNPYMTRIDDGDIPAGVAGESCAIQTTDGDQWILVDICSESVFRVPVISGTISAAYIGKSCDCAITTPLTGIDLSASTDDCAYIVDVTEEDIADNYAHVTFNFKAGYVGVV